MLAARGGGRRVACAVLSGGLQHPLAAAGHRPSGPARAFLRLVCGGYVGRRPAGRGAGITKGRRRYDPRGFSAVARACVTAGRRGALNFASRTGHSPERALEIARRIQFHQVTLGGNTSASGLSDTAPVQRQIFEALKLELPTKDRPETTL